MIIYGKQLFFHIIRHKREIVKSIYLAKKCDKISYNEIANTGIKITLLDFKKAQAMAKGANHQGFLAQVDEFEFACVEEIKKFSKIAVLYELSDVGNMGAIIRSAHALGVEGVIIVAKNVQMSGILRSSSGAAYEIRIANSSDGLGLINELKQVGFTTYATSVKGLNANEMSFESKSALIVGSEGAGMSKKALLKCDKCLTIPMKNGWDSLNVSAAFAIICNRMMNE